MSDNRVDIQGCYLKMGNAASPEVFTAFGELAGIPEVGQEYSSRDRTTLADTHQKIHQGLAQVQSFDVEVAYNPDDTVQAAAIVACNAKTEKNFKLVYSDTPATEYNFTGKIMKYTAPYSKGVDADAMIKFTIAKTSLFT